MVMTTVGIDCDALIREMPCHDVKLEDVGEREWKTVNVDHRRCYKLKREKERAKTRFRWVFFQQSIGRDLYRFQLKPSRNEEGIKSSGMDRNAIVRVEQMELMWFCTWNFPDIIL